MPPRARDRHSESAAFRQHVHANRLKPSCVGERDVQQMNDVPAKQRTHPAAGHRKKALVIDVHAQSARPHRQLDQRRSARRRRQGLKPIKPRSDTPRRNANRMTTGEARARR